MATKVYCDKNGCAYNNQGVCIRKEINIESYFCKYYEPEWKVCKLCGKYCEYLNRKKQCSQCEIIEILRVDTRRW